MRGDVPLAEFQQARRHWFWYLVLGVLLIVLGVVALGYSVLTTLVSVLFFGWLLIISGIVQSVQAFQLRGWDGFFLHLLGGVLEVVVGFLMVRTPGEAALILTLLAAAYLLVGGLFRLIAAFALWFPGSWWVGLAGLVSVLLGLIVAWGWPISGLTFIGICVGVDLILHGAAWVAFAFGVRELPESASRVDSSAPGSHAGAGAPGGA